jgi:hypothetical protein
MPVTHTQLAEYLRSGKKHTVQTVVSLLLRRQFTVDIKYYTFAAALMTAL